MTTAAATYSMAKPTKEDLSSEAGLTLRPIRPYAHPIKVQIAD